MYIDIAASAVVTFTSPTCAGYNQTLVIVDITLPTGQVLTDVATNITTFNACALDCFYIDPLLNVF